MDWFSLVIAGGFELVGVAMLNKYNQTKNIKIIWLIIVAFGSSFFFLSYAMKTLPMGLTYAIWTGIGGSGGAIIGIYFYGESKEWKRIGFIATIIVSVIGLKLASS